MQLLVESICQLFYNFSFIKTLVINTNVKSFNGIITFIDREVFFNFLM